MMMVIKQSVVTDDELVMAIDPTTKQLLHYEDKTDDLKFNRSYLTVNPCFSLHNDKQDCFIDICSPQVLGLFTDSFDPRRHSVRGSLVKIFTHDIRSSYYAKLLISNNNPTKLASANKSEPYTESYRQIFEKKVEGIFVRGVHKKAKLPRIFRALRKCQLTCGMAAEECARAMLYSIMKLALDNSKSCGNDLVKETKDVILKWGILLNQFSRGVPAQIQMMLEFEEMCSESMEEYAPLFEQVLYILYNKKKIQKAVILVWADDTLHAGKSHKVFVKQTENFIHRLKEEKYLEADLKRLNEGGVQVKKIQRMKIDLKEGGVQSLSIC